VSGRSTADGEEATRRGTDAGELGVPKAEMCESLLELKSILLEGVADGVIAHTPDGEIIYANTRCAEILGITHEQLISSGRYGWTDTGDAAAFQERVRRIRQTGGTVFESKRTRPDGATVYIEVHSRTVNVLPWGELLVSVSRDVTARVAAQEALRRLAFHDSLTGLGNRLMLHDRMEHALATTSKDGEIVGVVYMDLDDFKPVNDAHGHDVGDRVLRIVGERLQHCVRDTDTIARVGGDEFIALFPDVADGFDLRAKAQALAECVSQSMAVDGIELKVTMTVGLATHEHGESIDDLIRRADLAMYESKTKGRPGWEDFQPAE